VGSGFSRIPKRCSAIGDPHRIPHCSSLIAHCSLLSSTNVDDFVPFVPFVVEESG
jgi:hypothetical protein